MSRVHRTGRVGRTFVGACTVEQLVHAAINFMGGHNKLVSLIPGLVYLIRRLAPFRGAPTRRHLLDPFTRCLLEGAWDRSDDAKDGGCHGFRPISSTAFLWRSRTGSQLLAIPVPGKGESVQGYLLELSLPPGQGSHYGGVLPSRDHWQTGEIPKPGEEEDETEWQTRLEGLFNNLLKPNA
jgi:hypothetical protein